MLVARNLPSFVWEEAVNYACYLKNRSPPRTLKGKTPYKAFWGKKPNLSNIRESGMEVWILKPEPQHVSKLDPTSEKCIFVGFAEGEAAIRYYNPRTRKVLTMREAHFPKGSAPVPQDAEVPRPHLEGESESSHADDVKASPPH